MVGVVVVEKEAAVVVVDEIDEVEMTWVVMDVARVVLVPRDVVSGMVELRELSVKETRPHVTGHAAITSWT